MRVAPPYAPAGLSAAQRQVLAESLVAIAASVLGLLPTSKQLDLAAPGALLQMRSLSNPNMLALATVQQQLLQFLTAEQNVHLLSLPLPPAFLAQRNGLARSYSASIPLSTWRTLLAEMTQQCSIHTIPAICAAMINGHQGGPMAEQPDMLALLAAIATWPLEAALAHAPAAAALLPFTQQGWLAANAMVNEL